MKRFLFVFCAATLGLTGLGLPASAIEFRSGERVLISPQEVIADDLYLTGDSIIIDGVVQGDIVAVGRHIVLNGASFGDFIAAGQGIVVNGQVADDVRIAGFALRLGNAAAIGDDVIGAGFSLEASKESLVAGGLVFSGFQALLAGEVREKILGQMASLRIEGIVGQGGEVSVDGGESTPPFMQLIPSPVAIPRVPAGLTIGEAARVAGDIVYTSPDRAVSEEGSRAILTHVEVSSETEEVSFAERALWSTWRFVSVLVIGFCLLLLAPGWIWQRVETVSTRPLASAGWGLAGLLGVPVLGVLVAVVAVLTVVLLGLLEIPALALSAVGTVFLAEASLVVGFLAVLFLVGPAIICLWLGRQASRSAPIGQYVVLLIGWVVIALLLLIPVVGGFVKAGVVVLGLGCVISWITKVLFQGNA
jgi:hypothetical protein